MPGSLFDESLEALDEFLLIISREFTVHKIAMIFFVLEGFDHHFERLVIFSFALLHAKNHVAIHLNKTAIAIPSEALVGSRLGKRQHSLVIQTEIQNGVHHARHGIASTGTNRNQQRHPIGIPKFAAHYLFHFDDSSFHLRLKRGRVGALVRIKISADFRGRGESRRHRQTDAAHFREVRALATEQRFHGAIAVRCSCSEEINILRFIRAAF